MPRSSSTCCGVSSADTRASARVSAGPFRATGQSTKYPNVDGELYRVLRPGGRLVFAEGIRSNPVYNAARNLKRWLTGEEPKGDIEWEYEDVMEFASRFTEADIEFYYLTLSMKDVVGRSRDQVAPVRALFYVLDHFDEWLLRTFPRLQKYAKETSGCLIK